MTDEIVERPEKETHTCSKSGKEFQYPNGAKCSVCDNWFSTKHYIYIDMEPVCLDCHKEKMRQLLLTITKSLKQDLK